MINLISEIFAFNWHRFTIPGVIAGLVLLAVGMTILISSSTVASKINVKRTQSGKAENSNIKLMLYGIAAVFVVTGALLAIFMAE